MLHQKSLSAKKKSSFEGPKQVFLDKVRKFKTPTPYPFLWHSPKKGLRFFYFFLICSICRIIFNIICDIMYWSVLSPEPLCFKHFPIIVTYVTSMENSKICIRIWILIVKAKFMWALAQQWLNWELTRFPVASQLKFHLSILMRRALRRHFWTGYLKVLNIFYGLQAGMTKMWLDKNKSFASSINNNHLYTGTTYA